MYCIRFLQSSSEWNLKIEILTVKIYDLLTAKLYGHQINSCDGLFSAAGNTQKMNA